jgi:hypothetical protein
MSLKTKEESSEVEESRSGKPTADREPRAAGRRAAVQFLDFSTAPLLDSGIQGTNLKCL